MGDFIKKTTDLLISMHHLYSVCQLIIKIIPDYNEHTI